MEIIPNVMIDLACLSSRTGTSLNTWCSELISNLRLEIILLHWEVYKHIIVSPPQPGGETVS